MPNIGIDRLTIKDIMKMVREETSIQLSDVAKAQVTRCREYIDGILNKDKTVYGVNTGFGPLCDVRISDDDINLLQENLLLTHAVGVGEYLSKELTTLMLISKIHALAKGHSGVRVALLDRLIYFVNNDLIPAVPSQGSVGASGDLAPLSHLFLPVIGYGHFLSDNGHIPAKDVLKSHGLDLSLIHI